jgi:transposase
MTYRYVGLDVSQEKRDIALPTPEGNDHRFPLANSEEGFAGWLAPTGLLATSRAYPCRLAFFLAEQGQAVWVVNALWVKHFARLQLLKTDKADAGLRWPSAPSAPLATTGPTPH